MLPGDPVTSIDPSLPGCWRVLSIDMIAGKTVSLIGGLPDEYVEFTDDGRYRVDLLDRRPAESRFRVVPSESENGLDVWLEGLESLVAQCIYRIDGDDLIVCVAGNHGPRPTEIRRDDGKLWCVIQLTRSQSPNRRRRTNSES